MKAIRTKYHGPANVKGSRISATTGKKGQTVMLSYPDELNSDKAHPTQWTVVIDPPNRMTALMRFTKLDLADVYMRNLKDNNPGAYAYSYILKPGNVGSK